MAFDVALTVRFIPFSELTRWSDTLSEEKLIVPKFEEDELRDERHVQPHGAADAAAAAAVMGSAAAIELPDTELGAGAFQWSAVLTAQEAPDSCQAGASALATFWSVPEQRVSTRTAQRDNQSAPLMRRQRLRDRPNDILAAEAALREQAA